MPRGGGPAELQTLHGLTGLSSRLPKMHMPPKLPTGKKMYTPIPLDQQIITQGPGTPPQGFLGPYNSVTEWYIYWALSRIFHNPPEFRKAPFEGGWPDWQYQKAWNGGRDSPGGSVIDFVILSPAHEGDIALRVVTEYWHLFANAEKHASDDEQRYFLEDDFILKDVYDQDFINDPSGQAAIITCKNVCSLLERPNPNWIGTAIRGSRMDLFAGGFY